MTSSCTAATLPSIRIKGQDDVFSLMSLLLSSLPLLVSCFEDSNPEVEGEVVVSCKCRPSSLMFGLLVACS